MFTQREATHKTETNEHEKKTKKIGFNKNLFDDLRRQPYLVRPCFQS